MEIKELDPNEGTLPGCSLGSADEDISEGFRSF